MRRLWLPDRKIWVPNEGRYIYARPSERGSVGAATRIPLKPMGLAPWPMLDTFDGAANTPITSHVANTGQSWIYKGNSGGTTAVIQLDGSGNAIDASTFSVIPPTIALVEVSDANQDVSVYAPSTVGNGWGCALRALDANNFWWAFWQTNGGGRFALAYLSGGSYSGELATSAHPAAPTTGDVLRCSVTAANLFTFYFNGTSLFTLTNATMATQTRAGLANYAAGSVSSWDKITIAQL